MSKRRLALWASLLAVGLASRFALETVAVDRMPPSFAVALAVVPASLGLLAVSWGVGPRTPAGRRDHVVLALAGIGGIWLVPLLVASVRGTDSPPGAEVLFLTSAVWGLVLVAFGLMTVRPPNSGVRLAVALLGVTAAVAILANWERPSSFSPFIRYGAQEMTIVLAGMLWAFVVVLLVPLVRRLGPLYVARASALPAAVVSVTAALVLSHGQAPGVTGESALGLGVPLGASAFAVVLAWLMLIDGVEIDRVAAVYFVTPVMLTALSVLERVTFAFGPNPMVVPPVVAGVSVACAAAAALSVAHGSASRVRPSRAIVLARGVSIAALVAAMTAIVMPDLQVHVAGSLSSGAPFDVTFSMLGFESVGGWLALCCSLLVAAWAWSPSDSTRVEAVVWMVALTVAAVAWIPAHDTPTHNLNTWIPSEVQQDYGTEHASRTTTSVTGPLEPAALVAALCSGALLVSTKRKGGGEAFRGQEVAKA